MIAEITAACRFFGQQLNQPISTSVISVPIVLDHSQIQLFESELAHALQERFLGHWYAENPIKGQAYRSILADFEHGLVDSALVVAAERSKIHDFLNRGLPSVRMWVDPGEVSVEPIRGRSREVILYRSRSTGSSTRNKSSTSSTSSSSLSANAAPFHSRKSPPLGPMSAPSLTSSFHVSTSGLYTAADHERLHASSSTYLHPSYDQQLYQQQQQQASSASNLWSLDSQQQQLYQQYQASSGDYYLHSAARNQLAY